MKRRQERSKSPGLDGLYSNSFITEGSEHVESWAALSMSVTLLPSSLKGPGEASSLEFPQGSKEIHTGFFL